METTYFKKTCYTCKKEFHPLYLEMWTYRDTVYNRWYCSWTCMRQDEKTKKKKMRKVEYYTGPKLVAIDRTALGMLLREDGRKMHEISKAMGRCESYVYNIMRRDTRTVRETYALRLAKVLNADPSLFVREIQ